MALSDRLAILRKSAGYTQESLAERLGKSQRTIAAWELGDRAPSFDMLCEIADLFEVSTDYLLNRTDIPNVYNNSAGAGEAARAEDPQAMPSDVRELKELIIQIVDQALDARLPASGGR